MPKIESTSIKPVSRPTTKAAASTTTATPAVASPPVSAARDQLQLSGVQSATLTAEEVRFLEMKLLPNNYADLKACLQEKGLDAAKEMARAGKKGPFTSNYGNPDTMLDTARRISKNPELLRMCQDLKKGDLLVENWNCDTPISELTKGPYIHTVICTEDGPPPDFIEAFGLMGTSMEEGSNCVRRVPLSSVAYDGLSIRVVRPAENLPEPQKSEAIAKAIQYVEEKLGAPYDYAMTNNDQGQEAFYCSELAYKAYAEGAKIDFPVSKSPERDRMVVAINDFVNTLKPKDKAGLVSQLWQFLSKDPAPTSDEFIGMIVDKVLPSCKETEKLCQSEAARTSLKVTIKEVMEGKAFQNFGQKVAELEAQEKNGAFKGFFGSFKRMGAFASVAKSFLSDAIDLVKRSGIHVGTGIKTAVDLLKSMIPHGENLATYFWGSKDSKTQQIKGLLDQLDWLKTQDIPLISNNIPGRVKNPIESDFVSPTDLAYSASPHTDYNVKPS